jgi:shikimate kinase
MNIFLIGYRCTGKTTVGESLAGILGWSFVDMDADLVDQIKTDISDFVSKCGWKAFREKESQLLTHVCAGDRQVVATGGGVVLDRHNVESMQGGGKIIWLQAKPQTIKQRLMQDIRTETMRPALTSKGLLQEIEETLADRCLLYENAADVAIGTDHRSVEKIANSIIAHLERVEKG